MKNHKKDEMKLVVAVESCYDINCDFKAARLFDSIEHMEETLRKECGCYLTPAERKKSAKLAKSFGLPKDVSSRATCYSVARQLIERMSVQEFYIYELNTLEAEFVSILKDPSAVKLYMVLGHISYLKNHNFNVNGIGGMVSNLAAAWKEHMISEDIKLRKEKEDILNQKNPTPTPGYTGLGAGEIVTEPLEETLAKASPEQMFCVGDGKWIRVEKSD